MTALRDETGRPAPSNLASLGRELGLTVSEGHELLAAFAHALGTLGLDGSTVVARLEAGASTAEALSLPPGLCDLLYARAHNWFNIGRYDKAEALFRALCVLDGRSRDYWLGYGICLKVRGDMKASNTALRIAAQVDPKSALPPYHLLDLAMRCGAWEQAADHLRAYDRCADTELPAIVMAEANKYRSALAQRPAAAAQQYDP